ncbi:hypothetical protein LGN24_02155 [Burkholderia seminalis]|nr:hypothetical protein [Burkholderia seminalis]
MRTRPPFRRTSRLRVVPLTDDSFDVCIRFGEPPASVRIWRISRGTTPGTPHDLTRHTCIGIRQDDEEYGA